MMPRGSRSTRTLIVRQTRKGGATGVPPIRTRIASNACVVAEKIERRSALATHAKFPQCFDAAHATPRSEKQALFR